MYFEIRKAGFINKGAELMLLSVVDQIMKNYTDAKLVMAPGHEKTSAPYINRAMLGFYQKAWLWRFGIQLGDFARFAPAKLREMYGVILDKDIDVVFDAAGFSYSEQWGDEHSIELAKASRRWRKRGTKIILLPQAFGPFKSNRIKLAVKEFISNVDLVYARDVVSYDYLIDVVGQSEKIKISPDFTNLLNGVLPDYFDSTQNRVCIIPNCRMIDKTDSDTRELYIPFLKRVSKLLLERDGKPFFLIHEGEDDLCLASEISYELGGLNIIVEQDPLKIKGIIGSCDGTIGSRFHGLASSLSQGVPALSTGWSHKYKMLFNDYGFSEGVLDVNASDIEMNKAIDFFLIPEIRENISDQLNLHSLILKEKTNLMWHEIFNLINDF